MNTSVATEYEPDPHPDTSFPISRSSGVVTAADADLEAKIRAVPVVRNMEAEVWKLKVELTQARAKASAENRAAFQDRLAGTPLTAGVFDAGDAIALLEGLLAGSADCLILARHEALKILESAPEAQVAQAHGTLADAKKKLDRLAKGNFEAGELPARHSSLDQIAVIDAARHAENVAINRLSALQNEAALYRNERLRLKREHGALFAAEGVK